MGEEVEFRVSFFLIPVGIQPFQYFFIVLEHLKEFRQKGFGSKDNIFGHISFGNGVFNNLVQFHAFCLQVFHFQVWSDDDFVFLEHLDHVGGNA